MNKTKLDELQKEIDLLLESETPESLRKWLDKRYPAASPQPDAGGEMAYRKGLLIHVLKSTSLFDLSECDFDFGIDDNNTWVNAVTKTGKSVVDAILWDGNLFQTMTKDGDFCPYVPLIRAFREATLYALATLPTKEPEATIIENGYLCSVDGEQIFRLLRQTKNNCTGNES